MYIGHIATAFAAKKIDPQPCLATYVLAAELPDVLFSALSLIGVESAKIVPGHTAVTPLILDNYPYSHSLVGTLMAGLLLTALFGIIRRNRRGALVLLGLTVGHWILDVISHTPDIPVGFNGPMLGLGLWNSIAGTFAVEGAIFIAGVWLYLRSTRPKNRAGTILSVVLIGFLALTYISVPFGEPPPNMRVFAIVNNIMCWLIIILAAVADHNRLRSRETVSSA